MLPQVNESDEDEEEYHSLAGTPFEEGLEDNEVESIMEPPVHPVQSMQAAFEESITESTDGDSVALGKGSPDSDAEARRRKLLEATQYDDAWTTRWKQRPGAQYHPLLKLMAQIVFGMHLLQQQQAKSNEEVVTILQTHVNEVDSFLERTSEDIDLAIADIQERIQHLKLPMEHLDVFNSMLTDKGFRTQLLDGNDKIEKIIDRTAKAMRAAMMDIQKGRAATNDLSRYLDQIGSQWPKESKAIFDVYGAMRGNEQGWLKYLKHLQARGRTLEHALLQLGTLIGEMAKLAAAASRRSRPSSRHSRRASPARSAKSMPASPALRSKFSPDPLPVSDTRHMSLNKPLPREPDTKGGAAAPKSHAVPFAQRYEQPRQSPQSPAPDGHRTSRARASSPMRPKTASGGREARSSTLDASSSNLAEFLRYSGPLRSNPPDREFSPGPGASREMGRSHSQGASEMLGGAYGASETASASRTKTHGGAMIVNSSGANESSDTPLEPSQGMRVGDGRTMSLRSESGARKDSFISTGFARRFSQRVKHIQHSEDERLSASSQRHGSLSAATGPAQALERAPTNLERPSTARTESTIRPPSRLGLFPKASEPSKVGMRSSGLTSQASIASVAESSPSHPPVSMRSSTKSRSLSLRKFFSHRKRESQGV